MSSANQEAVAITWGAPGTGAVHWAGGGPRAGEAPRPRRPRQSAAAWLGAEMRRARLEQGISQRRLTRLIGLSAHSNLGEYERGSRIPPGDIVVACERLLCLPPGHLQRLRQLALRERARGRALQDSTAPRARA